MNKGADETWVTIPEDEQVIQEFLKSSTSTITQNFRLQRASTLEIKVSGEVLFGKFILFSPYNSCWLEEWSFTLFSFFHNTFTMNNVNGWVIFCFKYSILNFIFSMSIGRMNIIIPWWKTKVMIALQKAKPILWTNVTKCERENYF